MDQRRKNSQSQETINFKVRTQILKNPYIQLPLQTQPKQEKENVNISTPNQSVFRKDRKSLVESYFQMNCTKNLRNELQKKSQYLLARITKNYTKSISIHKQHNLNNRPIFYKPYNNSNLDKIFEVNQNLQLKEKIKLLQDKERDQQQLIKQLQILTEKDFLKTIKTNNKAKMKNLAITNKKLENQQKLLQNIDDHYKVVDINEQIINLQENIQISEINLNDQKEQDCQFQDQIKQIQKQNRQINEEISQLKNVLENFYLTKELEDSRVLYSEDIFQINFENLGLNLEVLEIKKKQFLELVSQVGLSKESVYQIQETFCLEQVSTKELIKLNKIPLQEKEKFKLLKQRLQVNQYKPFNYFLFYEKIKVFLTQNLNKKMSQKLMLQQMRNFSQQERNVLMKLLFVFFRNNKKFLLKEDFIQFLEDKNKLGDNLIELVTESALKSFQKL